MEGFKTQLEEGNIKPHKNISLGKVWCSYYKEEMPLIILQAQN